MSKRVRNPTVEDIKGMQSMLHLINYYLDPKDGMAHAAYHGFSAEHHAAVNERVKALYDAGGHSPVDFFNVRAHIVPYLEDALKERIIGDCLEKKGTLYVYEKPDKALYKRVLTKHGAMHGFKKTRGFVLRSSINQKNVRMIQILFHHAKTYRGLALKKDKNRDILWKNMGVDFSIGEDYLPVLEVVDEIMIEDVYADYRDDAGAFCGKSRSGFYAVEEEKTKIILTLTGEADIVSMLLDNRKPLVKEREKKEDGSLYPPKIYLEMTEEGSQTTQTFCKSGPKQLMDFEKPDALLQSQMDKYGVVVTKKGVETVVTMPTPKLKQSKAGKEISEDSFLSHTMDEVLCTMSAWRFGCRTTKMKSNGQEVKHTYLEIGGKFWPARITIESDNIGGEEHDDGISDAHRDIEIPYDEDE